MTCVTAYRTVTNLNVAGDPDAPGSGLQDFRDAIYYPVVSFLDGNNPYDPASYVRTYPVGNSFPLYLPSALILHLPFGLLPVRAAETIYFVVTAALMPVFAYLTLRLCGLGVSVGSVFGLASLILLSRPGHQNLFIGQYTASVAIGVYAALHFRRQHSWLAAAGVAVASLKPTYGVPLAALMLARRNVRPVLAGLLIAATVSAGATAVLIHNSGGFTPFLASLRASHAGFEADPDANPATSLYRIDAVALVARILGQPLGASAEVGVLIAILGLSALSVWRLERSGDDAGAQLSASLICVAILACTYHQTYDALLLALPLTALVANRWGASDRPGLRWVLLVLLAVPAFNYLASESVFSQVRATGAVWLQHALAALNSVALLGALCVYWGVALLRTRGNMPQPFSA